MIGNNWDEILADEYKKQYYTELQAFLDGEYAAHTIYPPRDELFTSLKLTPPEKVKAVIVGQDPYINENQAHGLAFSVQKGVKPPPSLVNMYKELVSDIGCEMPKTGCLHSWAEQGVLLLNAVQSVRAGTSNSHKNKGWEQFTDKILHYLGERSEPTCFLLWGAFAHKKESLIKNNTHLIIKTVHPSPLSAGNGFFGSKPYSTANRFLEKNGRGKIDWEIK